MAASKKYQNSPTIQVTCLEEAEKDLDQEEERKQQRMLTDYDEATNKMSTSIEKDQGSATKQIMPKDSSGGEQRQQQQQEQTHVYKKRFFILALFCAHSAINSFQWIQYSSITNVIANYYGASNIQVNYTSLVYMVTYIPFIIHASLMLEKVGLRKAVLLGTFGTALGSLIKWWFGSQAGIEAFWWMMAGQTIVALSQLYIISIPPLLAAVWFPDDQVSTATGIGVFGNQLGIALGFIIPPMVISNVGAAKDIIGRDLSNLACVIFWISFIICIVSFIAFQDKPPKPPGSASLHAAHQQQQQDAANNRTIASLDQKDQMPAHASIKELCYDRDFRYLVLSYGINVGCFYAVSTVLNQMVATGWPDLVDLAGTMGLLIVVSGMAGSVVCGQLLDRTHAYKLIITLIYLFSLISMVLFTVTLQLFTQVWPLYLASIVLGFFMTGYLPLGFEFAAEITYPHPANTPAGLLNLFAQVSIEGSQKKAGTIEGHSPTYI